MNLYSRLRGGTGVAKRSSLPFQQWVDYFSYGGLTYPFGFGQTLTGEREEIACDFEGLAAGAYRGCAAVFACELARLSVFTEARFQFQQMNKGRPGKLFGTPDLALLEQPEPGRTTGDLLARMILDADLAGTAYVARRPDARLKRLRPDWTTIVLGSNNDPKITGWDVDAEVIGYMYHPGGRYSGRDPVPYLANEVARFAPIPDPTASYRGMSWMTPVVLEVLGDRAATRHKVKFFENGATPNLAVKLDIGDPNEFEAWSKIFSEKYDGVENAYKTLMLGAGAEYTVIGADFKQLDFKITQGAGETRIAAASGVGAVIAGLSEGLQGSSLNAGNYAASRRRFADATMRPLWRMAAGALSTLVPPPSGTRLWYDDRDVSFLQEDVKDGAEILAQKAQSIRTLVDGGYTPESAVAAVEASDLSLLVHTGLYSVQLQPPGSSSEPGSLAAIAEASALIAAAKKRFEESLPPDPSAA